MTASVTLIIVGVFLLMGGDWPTAYALMCIIAGAGAWHALEHARRGRPAIAHASPRLAAVSKVLTAAAGTCEAAAVLVVGGYAFGHPEAGLFNGLSIDALIGAAAFGAALCTAAAQLQALRSRLSEEALARFSPSRGNP